MIDPGLIAEILSTYKKHGWTLRRVLLSDALRGEIGGSAGDLFGAAEISRSRLDGLWFSRRSKGTLEAWELRHLGSSPFALLEVMESECADEDRETVLSATELRMQNILTRKN